MRAAAHNPQSSQVCGIPVATMLMLGWGAASAVGAVAGMMVAPVVYLDPQMMSGVLLYAFAGALLGGLTNPWGAVLGGIVIGVLENILGAYVIGADLKMTAALALILAVAGIPSAGPAWPARNGAGPDPMKFSIAAPLSRRANLLCAAAIGAVGLAIPFFVGDYRLLELSSVLVNAIAVLGLILLDRVQRPGLARPWRLLCAGCLHRGDPNEFRRSTLLPFTRAGCSNLLRLRLPIRPPSSAAARAICWRWRRSALPWALPQVLRYHGVERWTGGVQGILLDKAGGAVRHTYER